MNQKPLNPASSFGLIGGLMTFIFGGWSVAVVGVLMGIGLGLTLSGQLPRKAPAELAVETLFQPRPCPRESSGLSLLQNYFVAPAIGQLYQPPGGRHSRQPRRGAGRPAPGC